jgi:hypothetical protein
MQERTIEQSTVTRRWNRIRYLTGTEVRNYNELVREDGINQSLSGRASHLPVDYLLHCQIGNR